MDKNGTIRIQADAAKALAGWKALFAEQVVLKAKELAQISSPPGLITLTHYRQAAVLAAQALVIEVHRTDSIDGRQKAA
jgi:hypothetical protein